MIADLLDTALLRVGVFLFVCVWLVGFVLRFVFNSAMSNSVDLSTMPAYRQIRVVGVLRWLFGYRPTDGPVSVASFVLQLPALLTLMTSIVLNSFWPTLRNLSLAPFVVLVVTMPISVRLADHLWQSQQRSRPH